jgi:ABC-2 type transport system permease protein
MSSMTWLVIARREFLERVRSKWFIVITVLGPLVMSAIIVVPAWLAARTALDRVKIQVVDRSGHNLFPEIVRNSAGFGMPFDFESVSPDIDEKVLLSRIRDEKINGFLYIPAGLLDGEKAIYRGDNATNLSVATRLQGALYQAARDVRARAAGVDPDVINRLNWPKIELEARHDTGRGPASQAQASFLVGYVVMFVLYMSILIYAVNVMRSVVLEKTSRVVEIVVSATRPSSLMFGKVIGVGSVGLLQLGIWSVMALLLFRFRAQLLGLLGVEGAGDVALPPLALVDIAVILAYFALGYFFYAALYAAIGAMVNSDQEGQQAQTPVVLMLILPVVCVQLVANNPRGPIAQVLTLIPFSSPILMPMRYLLSGASPMEIALSMAILLASLLGAVWIAGRIYRIGILMYGKRPSLRELGRWIRYSS